MALNRVRDEGDVSKRQRREENAAGDWSSEHVGDMHNFFENTLMTVIRERLRSSEREITSPTTKLLCHRSNSKKLLLLDAFEEYHSFFAARVQRLEARRHAGKRQKKEHLQKRGKLLKYDKVTPELQSLLHGSKCLKFKAVRVISSENAEHML